MKAMKLTKQFVSDNGQDIDQAFENIVKLIQLQELDYRDLQDLDSVKKLNAIGRDSKDAILERMMTSGVNSVLSFGPMISSRMVMAMVVFAMLSGVTMGIWSGLHTKEGFSRTWLRFQRKDVEEEFCTIRTPTSIQNAFMPPVDCSICRGIQVERVANISQEEFEERYAYTGVPVIVTDAMNDWTAPRVFSWEFFKEIYSKDSPALYGTERDCQFFPYKTDFRSLADVFEMTKERADLRDGSQPWYVGWSNCDPSVANILRSYYQKPYFLPELSEGTKLDWIFMGSPGYGAHMHIDHVRNPSWQAQIKGQKLWTLEPVPECYSECQTIEITVKPGEIIVLDTNRWYHKTLIVGDDMSITIGSEYD